MNNNLKQAFSEVFGKPKNTSSENTDNSNESEEILDEVKYPPTPEPFDGFEELEPTGTTMSDDDKALIDKKAQEFKESLGIQDQVHKYEVNKNINKKPLNKEPEYDDNLNNTDQQIVKNQAESLLYVDNTNSPTNSLDNQPKREKEYKIYDFKAQFNNMMEQKSNDENIKNDIIIEKTQRREVPTVVSNNKKVSEYAPTYNLKPIGTTFIDENTVIQGSMVSQSNLNICGEVEGDITCSNDIATSGKIKGNIECENFVGDKSVVEGNVMAKKSIILKNNSLIKGDVSAELVEVSGKITGNILSATDISIYENSAVYGDISANSIFVEKGSVIQGKVNIKYELKKIIKKADAMIYSISFFV